ncbi:C40 family peptidase [Pseudonocardia sp. D17]|uniref:C40 family peptidase n=1 Tax=Pseudonocardia sp. D17 TaxID=882661 RepID=UPI002B3EB3D3|nr:lipoprotein [Pseudonocardia sp. D17]
MAFLIPTLTPPVRRRRGRRVGCAVVVGAVALLMVAVIGVVQAGPPPRRPVSCVAALAPPPPPGRPGRGPQWTDEQRRNASSIVETGRSLGVPDRARWIAVATAMQESSLRNLAGGDRDSAGLFQQRPSQGWGSLAQVRDPVRAAASFYDRLLAVPGWDRMPLTEAAQTVQRSAFPEAYARWEQPAADLLAALGTARAPICVPPPDTAGALPADALPADAALDFARGQLGKPYAWGAAGPSAFDCSGLVVRAWEAAGVQLPRTSRMQATAGARVPRARARPGDLLFWSSNGQVSGVHHVALYLGNDRILEAPQAGSPVRTRDLGSSYDVRELLGFAVRPGAAG